MSRSDGVRRVSDCAMKKFDRVREDDDRDKRRYICADKRGQRGSRLGFAPLEKVLAPAQRVIAPLTGVIATITVVIAPVEGVIAPLTGVMARFPGVSATNPSEGDTYRGFWTTRNG